MSPSKLATLLLALLVLAGVGACTRSDAMGPSEVEGPALFETQGSTNSRSFRLPTTGQVINGIRR